MAILLDSIVKEVIDEMPEVSRDRQRLYWETLKKIGLVKKDVLTEEGFMRAPLIDRVDSARKRLGIRLSDINAWDSIRSLADNN